MGVNLNDARLPDRFWSKVQVDDSGCWLWTAATNASPATKGGGGYGRFYPGGEYGLPPKPAHRWAYTQLVGPVPEGLDLDHLCRVRRCVNPAHLEPVTRGENTRRGDHWQRRKTHCPSGHEYTEANTYVYRHSNKTMRHCRTCAAARSAARKG